MAAGETSQVRAQAKWVRTSARKARLVADHIRGRSVPEARAVLAFTPRAAAREVEKVLRSAVANAEANHGLIGDELVVSAAFVDEGPTLKRWRARARGRVARIRKRTCHITVLLEPAPAGAKATPARRRLRRGSAAAAPAPSTEPRTRRRVPLRPKAQPAPKAESKPPVQDAEASAEEKPRRRAAVRRRTSEQRESE